MEEDKEEEEEEDTRYEDMDVAGEEMVGQALSQGTMGILSQDWLKSLLRTIPSPLHNF